MKQSFTLCDSHECGCWFCIVLQPLNIHPNLKLSPNSSFPPLVSLGCWVRWKQLIGFNSTAWTEFLAETPRLFICLYFRLTRCKSVWICTFCIDCVYQNWSEHVIRFSDGLVIFAHHSHVSCPVWRKNSVFILCKTFFLFCFVFLVQGRKKSGSGSFLNGVITRFSQRRGTNAVCSTCSRAASWSRGVSLF